MASIDDLPVWRGKNPLSQFRMQRSITMHDAATVIGVSVVTVSAWENGSTNPSDDHFSLVAKFIRTSEKALRLKWDKWLAGKPNVLTR